MSADIVNFTYTAFVDDQTDGFRSGQIHGFSHGHFTSSVYRKLLICQSAADDEAGSASPGSDMGHSYWSSGIPLQAFRMFCDMPVQTGLHLPP